jgi:hypothetical protein
MEISMLMNITQFDEYRMRCVIRKDETMTPSRFQKDLNDDLRREVCPPLMKLIP